MPKIPKKYLPYSLTPADRVQQRKELEKSRSDYKKGRYHQRAKVASFQSKRSIHLKRVTKIYGLQQLRIDPLLAKKSGLTIEALQHIVKKGEGAYYASGSRPNQTAHAWGLARLASAITGGKAAVIDFAIIEEGSQKRGIAYQLALLAKEKFAN